MNNFHKQLKKILFIFSLLLVALLLSLPLCAQQEDEDARAEKQLKIFQLSYLLEKDNGFSVQKAYFNNALAYLENGHSGMAIAELEKIEYNNLYIPLYLKSQLLSAQCYENLKRWESAIRIYQDLLTRVPVMQEYVIYLLARAYQNIKDNNNAIKSYSEIIAQYPHSTLNPLVHYQLALLYQESKQEELFWQECHLAVETSAEEKFKAKVLIKMCDTLWEEGKYLDSLNYLKEIIENRYERERISWQENLYINRFQEIKENILLEIPPGLSLFFAETIFNYGRYKMAEMVYEEMIGNYAGQIDLPRMHYHKARAIYYQGEYQRAIDECLYILENFKETDSQKDVIARTLYLYAGALLSTGNRSRAAEKYKEIIEKYSEHYFAQLSYFRLSEIGFLENKAEEGVLYLKELLIDFPESSLAQEAAWELSRYYTNQNSVSEALSYYQFIYEHFPRGNKADDALYWLGKLLYSTDKAEGMQWYEHLITQFPDSYYSFRIPAEMKSDEHNLENIIEQCKTITPDSFKQSHFPQDKRVQLATYRAELLMFLKLYQESVQEITNALKKESDNLYLQLLLIPTYAEAGEYYQAVSYAQAILNYFLSANNREFPLMVWQYAFPVFYEEYLKQTASSYQLDPYLIWSIMREESHFNTYAESRAGARGLMQIIFSTGEWIAQKLNYKEFEYDLLFQPRFNIELGCWYLKFLQEKFNQNNILMISGYNAGPSITDKWVETIDMNDMDFFVENIPYKETTEHIKKVIRSYLIYKIIY